MILKLCFGLNHVIEKENLLCCHKKTEWDAAIFEISLFDVGWNKSPSS